MARVLLVQLDGRMPNLALMRIAGHHHSSGDEIEVRHVRNPAGVERGIWDRYDRVYASCIFRKTRPLAERLRRVYPGAVIGGTGWDFSVTLESIGIPEDAPPDYSLWPGERRSIGFTQRGCRLSCEFCVVPGKEGKNRPVATVADIWRGEPWPRHLLLLDNDFFGQPDWRGRIAEIRDGRFKVSFNQGINARMLSEEAAEAIASVDYRDDSMVTRRLYTAWDSRGDEAVLFRGLSRLVAAGVKPDAIMVYMLVGFWPGETEADWLYRHDQLRAFGCRPYPMPFDRSNWLAVRFQTWCVGAYDKRVPWAEWKVAGGRPERLGRKDRVSLPMMD